MIKKLVLIKDERIYAIYYKRTNILYINYKFDYSGCKLIFIK